MRKYLEIVRSIVLLLLVILLLLLSIGIYKVFFCLRGCHQSDVDKYSPAGYGKSIEPTSFGSTKYRCFGSCYCFSEMSERRYATTSSRVVYFVSAMTSVVAWNIAEVLFKEGCERDLECHDPDSTAIISEVEDCELVYDEQIDCSNSKTENVKFLDKKVHIILGSESVYKRKVFKEIFPKCELSYTTADVDEKSIRHASAETLVLMISNAKTDRIIEEQSYELKEGYINILVTTDIVTRINKRILEKPEDEGEARSMIRSYGVDGSHPETVCGVVVVDLADPEKRKYEGVDIVEIQFDPIPEEVIDQLIDYGQVMNCCGALTIEDPRVNKYIMNIGGEESSVIGIPETMTKNFVSKILDFHLKGGYC